jgi:hypothetical protein
MEDGMNEDTFIITSKGYVRWSAVYLVKLTDTGYLVHWNGEDSPATITDEQENDRVRGFFIRTIG